MWDNLFWPFLELFVNWNTHWDFVQGERHLKSCRIPSMEMIHTKFKNLDLKCMFKFANSLPLNSSIRLEGNILWMESSRVSTFFLLATSHSSCILRVKSIGSKSFVTNGRFNIVQLLSLSGSSPPIESKISLKGFH